MSALSRAAVDNHKHAKIDAGDTVLLSSRIIPGNEKGIFTQFTQPASASERRFQTDYGHRTDQRPTATACRRARPSTWCDPSSSSRFTVTIVFCGNTRSSPWRPARWNMPS